VRGAVEEGAEEGGFLVKCLDALVLPGAEGGAPVAPARSGESASKAL